MIGPEEAQVKKPRFPSAFAILFVLIIGGFIGVVNSTGAIDAGISRAMIRMRDREKWMIPILMALIAAGGTTYGMAEETLAFHVLLLPVMIAAKYDAVAAAAVILLGAGVGVLGSTINAFATIIASDAAGIPFTDGLGLRLVILAVCWVVAVMFAMRYAGRVQSDPTKSLVFDLKAANEAHFLAGRDTGAPSGFTGLHQVILLLFAATFGIMIWGISTGGWWMAQMSGLFLFSAIVTGLIARLGERKLVESFIAGARDLLSVALIIGLARGIVVVMDAGQITGTILHWADCHSPAGRCRRPCDLRGGWRDPGDPQQRRTDGRGRSGERQRPHRRPAGADA